MHRIQLAHALRLAISSLACSAAVVSTIGVGGCGARQPGHVEGGVLGRVVVYRNGVAFYERRAVVTDGTLTVRVPRERVDDFLKSLTVVDPATRRPLAVTIPRQQSGAGSFLTMTLETGGARHAEVLLTYVTEAPAWKPSYRVVVGGDGKVMLEGWAIVDNTTSEDWNAVLVGVGASSALAFRYDLWSVRQIDRDLLAGEDRFAIAPPTGVSPYGEAGAEELARIGPDPTGVSFSGSAALENQYVVDGVNTTGVTYGTQGETITIQDRVPTIDPTSTTRAVAIDGGYTRNIAIPGRTFEGTLGSAAGSRGHSPRSRGDFGGFDGPPPPRQQDDRPATAPADASRALANRLATVVDKVRTDHRDVVIEVHGPAGADADAIRRGTEIMHQLVDDGVPARRIRIAPRLGDGEGSQIRVLAVARAPEPAAAAPRARDLGPDTPVGESHFMADRPMTVRAGTSAMVAMVHGETAGGVVYLYDPISERGDRRFAFKAVRLDNPTGDTLEPGPVTVYGDGRFIGEGITEPVPPHAAVVVPFALDKQIVVDEDRSEQDRIAKLVTVQRGVLTAEVQHRRTSRFTITSRLSTPAKVYLRHRLGGGVGEPSWALVEAPSTFTRVGDSRLFEVDLAAGETRTVTIAEAAPVQRTLELGSDEALGMLQVFVDDPEAGPTLKTQLAVALTTHASAADLVDKLATLRDQLAEYRGRARELHAQLVTLKAVKTGGELMATLRRRLTETSDRIQTATIAVVETQERLMLTRVRFQNQLADLRLEPRPARSSSIRP